jgi:hypothetical protein
MVFSQTKEFIMHLLFKKCKKIKKNWMDFQPKIVDF